MFSNKEMVKNEELLKYTAAQYNFDVKKYKLLWKFDKILKRPGVYIDQEEDPEYKTVRKEENNYHYDIIIFGFAYHTILGD